MRIIPDTHPDIGILSYTAPKLRPLLVDLCHELYNENGRLVTYIEIGIFYGGTFTYVLQNCKNIKIRGIGIDLFEDFDLIRGTYTDHQIENTHNHDAGVITYDGFKKKLKEMKISKYTLLKGDSAQMIDSFNKMKNVVCFIDGNHMYEAVKADFYATLSHTKNGYIVLDDVEPNHDGVLRFFNEIKDNYDVRFVGTKNAVFKIR
jgi:Methyltransferase domain